MLRGKPKVSFALAAILISALLVASTSCARKPDDARISSDVQTKYAQDSGLSAKQLSVQASNGVVTLGGFVDNDAQRLAAARQAASVQGVKEVVNNLQIGVAWNRPATAAKAPPAKIANSVPPNNPPPIVRRISRSRGSDDAAADSDSRNKSDSTTAENSPPVGQDPPPVEATLAVASTAPAAPAPAAPPEPLKVTIEQGTGLSVRLIDSIDTEKNQPGDTFHASLNLPLSAEGAEAIPAGTNITGHVLDIKNASKFAGQSLIVLQLDNVLSNGKTYSLQTDQYRKEGSSRGKSTAEKVGGGAILGGIIGAIAGGGKGAAVGTAAGAGVGAGAQASGKSQQIKLPSETVLNFTLQAPLTVLRAPDPNAGRPKLDESH
jgi:hypothetical protein